MERSQKGEYRKLQKKATKRREKEEGKEELAGCRNTVLSIREHKNKGNTVKREETFKGMTIQQGSRT